MISRRDLLQAAAATGAGGSLALLAACGGDGDDELVTTSEETARGDAAVLEAALGLERTAIAAYGAGLPLLDGSTRTLGRRLLAQERAHAEALSREIRRLGVTPTPPRAATAYRQDLPPLRSEDDFLRFALDIADTAVAAYLSAVERLFWPELRQLAVAINSSEAEHITLLRDALGQTPVATPFVGGPP